jgi:beta-N-acetylhexosaminidase
MSGQKLIPCALPLGEKIGQMLVVGFHGLVPPEYILSWLSKGCIGGVILFARNIDNPSQVAELTRVCHEASKHPILVAVDQEGGVVARLREGFTESPGAMALGAAGSEQLAEEVSMVLGAELRALGVNWNLAPAIDVTHNIDNPSVGVRSLGSDPGRVARLGVAQVRGFQRAGVAATAKHFPGKANTPVDPHVNLPVIDGPLDDMWDTDLVPFRAASEAGIAAMMVSHVQFKALEPEYPSTLSPRIIQGLLRGDVGFTGLVSTDCMEMKAVTNEYGPGESAVLAAIAGANTILFSHTREFQEEVYDALLRAAQSGRLPMETVDFSVKRVQDMKEQYAVTNQPTLDVIRQPKHLEVMERAARAGTVLICNDSGMIPLNGEGAQRITLVEFASHLEIGIPETRDETDFSSILRGYLSDLASIGIDPSEPSEESVTQARSMVSYAEVLIVATRNAHLIPRQCELAQEFLSAGKRSVLICLRNPYDAGVLTGAESTLFACGDSSPSLVAAADALVGRFSPSASLPVPLSWIECCTRGTDIIGKERESTDERYAST